MVPLIIEIFIECGVRIQELLQRRAGVGAGVMDGKCGSRQTAASREPGDDHPVLAAVGIFGAKKYGFSRFQLGINAV